MADASRGGRLDDVVEALLARADATWALADTELAPLARVAAELRHYPRPSFTAGLRARLQQGSRMPMTITTTRAREGFTTVTPYVRAKDSAFSDFVTRAFGAVEVTTTEGGGGSVHRELRVGSSMVMVGEGGPEGVVPIRPAAYHVYVEDVDATFARAVAAGGSSMGEPADRPYGERSGFVRDPLGNHWYIARRLTGPAVPEGLATLTPYLLVDGAPAYLDFLTRAFSATELERHLDETGRVMHAAVRIGNATLELGEPEPRAPMPTTFYLYVDDADALHAQAVAAGATSLSAPRDQWYGDRVGAVEDPAGNQWYIARPA